MSAAYPFPKGRADGGHLHHTFNPRCREMLVGARRRIEEGTERYICFALGVTAATGVSGAPESDLRQARGAVLDQLGEAMTYETWLYDAHDIVSQDSGRESARLGRLAWIDWMLEHHPLFANTERVQA